MKTRPIKFRVWDKEENRFEFNTVSQLLHWLQDGDVWRRDFDFKKIQQFTGLLDKNGREIYEGDIVEYNENFKTIREIYFDSDNSSFQMKFPKQFITKGFMERNALVLGNIYENPNLLKSP